MGTGYTQIQIEGDPTVWTLKKPIIEPTEITESTVPLALHVISPLKGILLLSVNAAFFVLLPPPEFPPNPTPFGWIPGDAQVSTPFLYLPSASVPATGPVRYQLPASVSLEELRHDIMAAMTDSATITLSFEVAGGVGRVAVNGATLPFAVIGPPEN